MKTINKLTEARIKKNLSSFEDGLADMKDEGRKPFARYASFDYCFNYFQGFKNKKDIASKENIQNSCLHLAFYLASWGMLRGSSFLLQKSIKFYEPLIKYISDKDDDFWSIDVSNYEIDDNINKLLECVEDVERILGEDGKYKVSDTLSTKIILGVFGCVPAYDQYFKLGSGLVTLNRASLLEISDFYKTEGYKKLISNEAKKVKTFEYDTCRAGKRSYTAAKVIDMIFFIEGFNLSIKTN